jgi:hypothetical protein
LSLFKLVSFSGDLAFSHVVVFSVLFLLSLLEAHLSSQSLRSKLYPEFIEVDLVLSDEFGVVKNGKVFLVHANSLRGPVEASSDKDLVVDEDVLVVHVGSPIVVNASFDTSQA